jgi:hypothetical protein
LIKIEVNSMLLFSNFIFSPLEYGSFGYKSLALLLSAPAILTLSIASVVANESQL